MKHPLLQILLVNRVQLQLQITHNLRRTNIHSLVVDVLGSIHYTYRTVFDIVFICRQFWYRMSFGSLWARTKPISYVKIPDSLLFQLSTLNFLYFSCLLIVFNQNSMSFSEASLALPLSSCYKGLAADVNRRRMKQG